MKKLPILAFLLLLFTPAMNLMAKPAEAAGQLPPSTTPIACYVNTGWGREEYLYIQYNVVNSIDGLRWALKVDGVDDDQIDQEHLIDFPVGEYTGYAKFKLGLNESNGYETYRYSMFIKDKQTSGLVPHKVYASGDLRALSNCVEVTDLLLTAGYADDGEFTHPNLLADHEYFVTHSVDHTFFKPGYDCSSGECIELPLNCGESWNRPCEVEGNPMPIDQHGPWYVPSGLVEEPTPINQHDENFVPSGFVEGEMEEIEVNGFIEAPDPEIKAEPITEEVIDVEMEPIVQEVELSDWDAFMFDLKMMLYELFR